MQVVAYDFGIKHNILRRLASFGCRITVVPANWPASEVLKMNPDGVFFSNGPVSGSGALLAPTCDVPVVPGTHEQRQQRHSLAPPKPIDKHVTLYSQ